jgi:hypothetical protein
LEADAWRTYWFFATKPVLLYNCFALGASLGIVVKRKIELHSFHFEIGGQKELLGGGLRKEQFFPVAAQSFSIEPKKALVHYPNS